MENADWEMDSEGEDFSDESDDESVMGDYTLNPKIVKIQDKHIQLKILLKAYKEGKQKNDLSELEIQKLIEKLEVFEGELQEEKDDKAKFRAENTNLKN